MSFNFQELNLSDSEIQGGTMLKPGKYVVKVTECKVGPTKANDGSQAMMVKLEDVAGGGDQPLDQPLQQEERRSTPHRP